MVIQSASCGKQPQISFTLDGTLASEGGAEFPSGQVTGGLAVTGEADASPHATRIVDHPISRLVSRHFLVRTGLGPGVLVGTDGSARKVTMQSSPLPAATGPVVSTGSGLRLWATIDAEAGTAAEVPGTRNMQEVMRLSDGSLAGLTFDTSSRTWTYARSVDGGEHWETRTLDVGDNALCSLVETDGTVDAVVEGADGATVFPFIAVHRAAPGEDAFAKIPGPPDPRAYLSGQLVLPDGRLLLGIENWQAVPAR